MRPEWCGPLFCLNASFQVDHVIYYLHVDSTIYYATEQRSLIDYVIHSKRRI